MTHRQRGRPRLGIIFCGALYAGELPRGAAPDLTVPPRLCADGSDALTRLLRCLPHFDVWIYPRSPDHRAAAELGGWLATQFRLWFEAHLVDDPDMRAAQLLHRLRITREPPLHLERVVATPEQWPTIDELSALDSIFDFVERTKHLASRTDP